MKRKIEVFLQSWKISSNKKPLIIRGARQIGKTFAVRQFAKTYRSFIEINLIDNTEFKTIFENGYSTEKIIQNISFRNPAFKFIPGDTLIFFDEMQEMPDCATSLKFFAEDGRFDIICSSSMMGLNYKQISSNSVGYKMDYKMYSMDFEEYLWAKGYDESFVEQLYNHLKTQTPFTETELNILRNLFMEYAVIGGMSEVIKNFLAEKNYSNILILQKQFIFDYEEDITKYASNMDKAKQKNIYRNIPIFLAKENKKFQISKLSSNARNRDYVGCINWLKDAGIINICYCLSDVSLPLKGNYEQAKYKIYYHDNGLLMASLDDEASSDLRKNQNLGVYKGVIYENLIG